MTGNKSIVFKFADVEVREREFCLVKAGEVLPVEPKTFRVLLFLLRNPQKLIAKEDLLNAVWGDAVVTDSSLTRTIAQLRRLLGDEIRRPRYIETVATVGYRFLGNVEVIEDPTVIQMPISGTSQTETSAPLVDIKQKTPQGFRRHWRWPVLAGSILLAGCVAGFMWYIHQPLAVPRITGTIQITNDGRSREVVAADWSRLYVDLGEPPYGIVQMPLSGGPLTPLQVDALDPRMCGCKPPMMLDLSSDGANLLVSGGGGSTAAGLWVVGALGHPARFLTEDASWIGTWSPDSKRIAYVTLEGAINLIPSDGGDPRRLVDPLPAGPDTLPHGLAWSPDGTRIRFTRHFKIWEVSPSGGNPQDILPGWNDSAWAWGGQWTPDGDFFLFNAADPMTKGANFWRQSGSQIWAMDERRGRLRPPIVKPIQLTVGPIRWGGVVPSRDGKHIFSLGVSMRGDLVRYDARSKHLEPFLKGLSAQDVAFSHDGKSIAYVAWPEGTLWRASRGGSGQEQLTKPPLYPINPRWSPDGKTILFGEHSSGLQNERSAIWQISSEGGAPRRLLPDKDRAQGDADWSPDGSQVVLQLGDLSSAYTTEAAEDLELTVFDLSTQKMKEIPNSKGLFSPRWSPDGHYIAALTISHRRLRIFDVNFQKWRAPEKGESSGLNDPWWSSDGRYIYYLRLGGTAVEGVFRTNISTGKTDLIFGTKDFRNGGLYGFWFGLDPDDSPMLLHNDGMEEIYALTLERK